MNRPEGSPASPWLWFKPITLSVRAARCATHDFIKAAGYADPDCTLELLVSELMTNAVLVASGGPSYVTLGLRVIEPGRIRASVIDPSPQPVLAVPGDPNPTDDAGRRMLLVQLLADSWGVEPGVGSKAVWVEVVLEPAARRGLSAVA